MESFSFAPAEALMRPVVGPFFLVLGLLLVSNFFVSRRPGVAVSLSDLCVLAGILLSFGLFDPSSLRHFFNPSRPMDWIPLLSSFFFILRTMPFKRVSHLLRESGFLLVSLTLLMFPLLHQSGFFQEGQTVGLIFMIWGLTRLIYPSGYETGIGTVYLLPLFLSSSALAAFSPLSGSLLLGQLSGGIAAVFGAMILATWNGRVRLTAIEPGWVLGALLVIGRQYAEISPVVIGSLVGSIVLGGLGARLGNKLRWPSWTGGILATGLSMISLAFGILEVVKSLSSQQGGY